VIAGDEVDVVLDQTAFYASSGGQAGDRGLLTSEPDRAGAGVSGNGSGAVAAVLDVQRAAGGALSVHSVVVQSGRLLVGSSVSLKP